MTLPTLDWTINAGQLVIAGILALLGWGLRVIYRSGRQFVHRVDRHEDRLDTVEDRMDETQIMVDRHSRSLTKWEPLGTQVKRLYRRRHDDSLTIDGDEEAEYIVP